MSLLLFSFKEVNSSILSKNAYNSEYSSKLVFTYKNWINNLSPNAGGHFELALNAPFPNNHHNPRQINTEIKEILLKIRDELKEKFPANAIDDGEIDHIIQLVSVYYHRISVELAMTVNNADLQLISGKIFSINGNRLALCTGVLVKIDHPVGNKFPKINNFNIGTNKCEYVLTCQHHFDSKVGFKHYFIPNTIIKGDKNILTYDDDSIYNHLENNYSDYELLINQKYEQYPSYHTNRENDVLLIKIKKPINVNLNRAVMFGGQAGLLTLYAAGYPKLSYKENQQNMSVLYTTTNENDSSKIRDGEYHYYSCPGMSGGPVYVNDHNASRILGVISGDGHIGILDRRAL